MFSHLPEDSVGTNFGVRDKQPHCLRRSCRHKQRYSLCWVVFPTTLSVRVEFLYRHVRYLFCGHSASRKVRQNLVPVWRLFPEQERLLVQKSVPFHRFSTSSPVVQWLYGLVAFRFEELLMLFFPIVLEPLVGWL